MPIDPRDLTTDQFRQEVKNAVQGAVDIPDAEQRIREHFSYPPLMWVQERGAQAFGMLLQQQPGVSSITIFCRRAIQRSDSC